MIKSEVADYIELSIIPQYLNFDEAHNIIHVTRVIANCLDIAVDFDVDFNMLYVIAAYHDIGLPMGREEHHKHSANILLSDKKLQEWFSLKELTIMAEAIEDHRASNENEPRSMYGKIIADADNDLEYESILLRCIQHGLAHYPEYSKEQYFARVADHLEDKYGYKGYLKTWLNSDHDRRGLQEIRDKLENLETLRTDFDKIFDDAVF